MIGLKHFKPNQRYKGIWINKYEAQKASDFITSSRMHLKGIKLRIGDFRTRRMTNVLEDNMPNDDMVSESKIAHESFSPKPKHRRLVKSKIPGNIHLLNYNIFV